MNFEDLHNELNSYPEDLKYTDARWEEALAVIEAHETKVRKRKAVFSSASAAVVVAITCWFLLPSKQVLSEYSPRHSAVTLFEETASEELEELPLVISEEKTDKQKSVAYNSEKNMLNDIATSSKEILDTPEDHARLIEKESTIHAEAELAEPIVVDEINGENIDLSAKIEEAKIEEKIKELPQLKKSEEMTSSEVISKETEGVETITPQTADNPLFINKKSSPDSYVNTDIDEVVDYSSTILRDQVMAVNKLPLKSRALVTQIPKASLLKNKELVVGYNGFTIYKNFLGAKFGLNPWADFGRTDLLGGNNASIGLFYEKLITDPFSWSAGVEYFSVTGIDLAVSSSNTSYNYGAESTVTTAHTNKAHFIAVPVNLSFRPFNRVQLKLGAAPGMLLETDNTVEEHFITHRSSELLSQKEAKGYRTSFNSMNITATAGVNYWFSKRNSLQIVYHKGLTDFSKNEAFNNSEKDLVTRIEISLNRVLR